MQTKQQNLLLKFNQNSMDIARNAQLIWPAKDLQ